MTEKKKNVSVKPKAPAPTQKPAKPAPTPTPTYKPGAKSEVITEVGLYQIKAKVGALNIKAIPIPGKRVLIVLPGSSKLIENLDIVKTGEVYSLK